MIKTNKTTTRHRTFADVRRDVDTWLVHLDGEAAESFRGSLVHYLVEMGGSEGRAEQVIDDLLRHARRRRKEQAASERVP
jgi:hypothetical protein